MDGSISVPPNTSMTAFSKNKSAKLFGTMMEPYLDGTSPPVPVVWYICVSAPVNCALVISLYLRPAVALIVPSLPIVIGT